MSVWEQFDSKTATRNEAASYDIKNIIIDSSAN